MSRSVNFHMFDWRNSKAFDYVDSAQLHQVCNCTLCTWIAVPLACPDLLAFLLHLALVLGASCLEPPVGNSCPLASVG